MGNPNEFDRELLSAYLDDALESSERSRAERLLATDSEASRYFEQLRATRECLKSVPSSTLRSSLTARVLEQARVQALADGLPSDHYVLRASTALPNAAKSELDRAADAAIRSGFPSAPARAAEPFPTHVMPSARHRLSPLTSRIMWSILAATAAVIGGLVVLPALWVNQPNGVVAKQTGPEQAGAAEQRPVASGEPEAASPFDSVAAHEATEPGTAVDHDSSGDQMPGSGSDAVAHVALDGPKKELVPQRPAFDFLMIIDAVVSTEAWESGRFEKLLEELGIPLSSPIVADKDLFLALEETRVVVGSAAEDASGSQPRAALLFLRADGATLDRLHQAMHQDRQSFPQIVTDISIDSADAKSALLHKLLRSQSSGQVQPGPSARVLASAEDAGRKDEVVPDFVPAQRRNLVSSDRTPAPSVAHLPSFNAAGPAPMSEVLVILREPRSK